jgi:hypothetical protein
MKSLLISLVIATALATGSHADTDPGRIKFIVAMLADVPILANTCSIPVEKQAAAVAMLDAIIEAYPEFTSIVDEVRAERLARPLTPEQVTTYCPVLIRFLDKVLH